MEALSDQSRLSHPEIAKHYRSVPHSLVRQEVEARITQRTVEIFLRGKRVASYICAAPCRIVQRPSPRAYAKLTSALS